MATKKKWIVFFPDDALLEAIEDYYHKKRFQSRSKAIQDICKQFLIEKGFYKIKKTI